MEYIDIDQIKKYFIEKNYLIYKFSNDIFIHDNLKNQFNKKDAFKLNKFSDYVLNELDELSFKHKIMICDLIFENVKNNSVIFLNFVKHEKCSVEEYNELLQNLFIRNFNITANKILYIQNKLEENNVYSNEVFEKIIENIKHLNHEISITNFKKNTDVISRAKINDKKMPDAEIIYSHVIEKLIEKNNIKNINCLIDVLNDYINNVVFNNQMGKTINLNSLSKINIDEITEIGNIYFNVGNIKKNQKIKR